MRNTHELLARPWQRHPRAKEQLQAPLYGMAGAAVLQTGLTNHGLMPRTVARNISIRETSSLVRPVDSGMAIDALVLSTGAVIAVLCKKARELLHNKLKPTKTP